MSELILYVLGVFFAFYLLNYAELTARPARWLKSVLGPQFGYPLSCAFCLCFWISLLFWYLAFVPFYYVIVTPPLHLFLDLAYSNLSPQPTSP